MKEKFFLLYNKVTGVLIGSNLGKIPGLLKIYDFVYNKINPENLILLNVHGHKFYINSKDHGVAPSLFKKGVYAKCETELLKNSIKPGTVFVDVGANVGYFTILASDLINSGHIYSFEPDIENYKVLIKNIKTNKIKNVTPIKKAVSNIDGTRNIFIDEKNLGSHSLSRKNVSNGNLIQKIETITLNSFFNDLSENSSEFLIKMDVQGSEGLIIKGAENLLKRENTKILMEFWPKGLINMGTDPFGLLKYLKSLNYSFKLIDDEKEKIIPMKITQIMRLFEKEGKEEINLLLEKEKINEEKFFKKPKKILLLNVGWSNKGNVALVNSTINIINSIIPGAEFVLTGPEDKFYDKKIMKPVSMGLSIRNLFVTLNTSYYFLHCVLFNLLKKFKINMSIAKHSCLYEYYDSDVIVNSGGDALSGENDFGSLLSLLNILYATILGKPVVLFSESIGYYQNPFVKFISKIVLNRTKLILIRENLSKNYLIDMGINKPEILLTADPAFLLKKSEETVIMLLLKNEGIENIKRPLFIINPSGLIYNRFNSNIDLVEVIADTIDFLKKNLNATIILIPHVYTEDSDDRTVIENIFDKLKDKSTVYCIKDEYSPEDLKGIIGLADLFIGMRMHALIAATSQCIPTVSIAYSHKTYGIIGEMLGQNNYILDIKNLDYESLTSKISEAWENRNLIKNDLSKKIPEIKNKAKLNGELFKKFIIDNFN